MTDRFLDRIAELADKTTIELDKIAKELIEEGLTSQADTLIKIAALHRLIKADFMTQTQPIDTKRQQLEARIKNDIEELRELAADFLNRGRAGHDQISEAADLLEAVLHAQ